MTRTLVEWPPKTIPRVPLGFVPKPQDRVLTLTEEQRYLAELLAETQGASIEGCTGTGKTQLVAAFAKAMAAFGRRVLVLSPRKPLAVWLRQSLEPHGVEVQTIDASAKAALSLKWKSPPDRHGFDDPAFFQAAIEACPGGENDLVIAEEWQTTSDDERRFILALAGRRPLVTVSDPSRDLRVVPVEVSRREEVLTLSAPLRSPSRIEWLDRLYATEGLDPLPSSLAAASVHISPAETPEYLQKQVLELLGGLRRRGIGFGEVGVVSGLARLHSALVTGLTSPGPAPRAYLLGESPSLNGLACDSFSYWLGLERRVIIVVEMSQRLTQRRIKMHSALSRACEEVHLVLPKSVIESDATLSGWLAAGASMGRDDGP
jgi:hypothetical protein